MSIYNYSIKTIDGEEITLEKYRGKVLLIVNTASKCGFTPQFTELETIYHDLGNHSFEILGFPCNQFFNQDPGNDSEIKNFCTLNYQVTFPMFSKIDVNGKGAHPLYAYLTDKNAHEFGGKIKWNFTKFLIDKEGNITNRYQSTTKPFSIKEDIVKLLESDPNDVL